MERVVGPLLEFPFRDKTLRVEPIETEARAILRMILGETGAVGLRVDNFCDRVTFECGELRGYGKHGFNGQVDEKKVDGQIQYQVTINGRPGAEQLLKNGCDHLGEDAIIRMVSMGMTRTLIHEITHLSQSYWYEQTGGPPEELVRSKEKVLKILGNINEIRNKGKWLALGIGLADMMTVGAMQLLPDKQSDLVARLMTIGSASFLEAWIVMGKYEDYIFNQRYRRSQDEMAAYAREQRGIKTEFGYPFRTTIVS